MHVDTFMLDLTLHARKYIHALWYITCGILHSCGKVHYMWGGTFMALETLYAAWNIHRSNTYTRGLINPSELMRPHTLHATPHSWKHLHYMHQRTFITYFLNQGINKGIGSWHPAHCIYEVTFMLPYTLHERGYVHAQTLILCASIHSWFLTHCMRRLTFMRPYTLHGHIHIHARDYITCTGKHSCKHEHYMRPFTFMDGGTLHA